MAKRKLSGQELEDFKKVQSIFNDIRKEFKPYFYERGFEFSNEQLFVFMMFLPMVLGTVADGTIEPVEAVSLKLASKQVLISGFINEFKLPESFKMLEDVENPMSDSKFHSILGQELELMAEGFSWYEDMIINSLGLISRLDRVKSYSHLQLVQRMSELMIEVCEENAGDNKIERAKLEEFFGRMGWLSID